MYCNRNPTARTSPTSSPLCRSPHGSELCWWAGGAHRADRGVFCGWLGISARRDVDVDKPRDSLSVGAYRGRALRRLVPREEVVAGEVEQVALVRRQQQPLEHAVLKG